MESKEQLNTPDGNYVIREYRPGKAKFDLIYSNGRDHLGHDVTLLEVGDEKFYSELVGHISMQSLLPEDKFIDMKFLDSKTRLEFISQLRGFGAKEVEPTKVFLFYGVKINLQ